MKKTLTIISGALTGIICLIMNFVLMPQIELTTEGLKCFDMNPAGYSYETAIKFLSLLNEHGRNVYLHFQLPLDFVYPVVYTLFFILMLLWLTNGKKAFSVIPAALMLCDCGENISVIKMLTAQTPSEALVKAASAFTVSKSVLMYLCFALIIVFAVIKAVKSRRKNR